MARTDWDSPLPIQSFSANFRAALNSSPLIRLEDLVFTEPQQTGDAHWIQSYAPKSEWDDLTGALLPQKALDRPKEALPRRMWEALATQDKTFQNWLKRLTPHQDIKFYMTLCDKQETETGHEFESRDKLDMSDDPSSKVIAMLTSGFITSANEKVINAIKAETSQRKMLDLNPQSETFGKVILKTENWKDNNKYAKLKTKTAGYISIQDDLPMWEAYLDLAGVPNVGRKIILLNPFDAGMVKSKNFKEALSKDFPFVTNANIANGDLPEMFGFSWVKCKQVPKGKAYVFIPEAISKVPYLDLEMTLKNDIMLRNHPVFYAHKEHGFIRNDDLGAYEVAISQEAQTAQDAA